MSIDKRPGLNQSSWRPLLPSTTNTTPVVLGPSVEEWLTNALKKAQKGRLKTIKEHEAGLSEVLSSSGAIWNLAQIKAPTEGHNSLQQDRGTLEGGNQVINIEGRIACVDMVHRNLVLLKLTENTIDSLAAYHEARYRESAANIEPQQKEFLLAIKGYVYYAPASVLKGLKPDGSGELPDWRKGEVQSSILSLMKIPPSSPLFAMDPRQTLLHVPPASPNMLIQYTLPTIAQPANVLPGCIGLPPFSQALDPGHGAIIPMQTHLLVQGPLEFAYAPRGSWFPVWGSMNQWTNEPQVIWYCLVCHCNG